MISKLGIGSPTFIFGLALNAFWKRVLHMFNALMGLWEEASQVKELRASLYLNPALIVSFNLLLIDWLIYILFSFLQGVRIASSEGKRCLHWVALKLPQQQPVSVKENVWPRPKPATGMTGTGNASSTSTRETWTVCKHRLVSPTTWGSSSAVLQAAQLFG